MNSIYDIDLSHLKRLVQDWNEPDYRADQIWRGIYSKFWSEPAQFSTLSKEFRKKYLEKLNFRTIQLEKALLSSDGLTEKLLFRSDQGDSFETVLMKYPSKNKKIVRNTICVSTQVGCAMGCVFCATGNMGFKRNLRVGEIIEQVIFFSQESRIQNQRITNIVYMGMGEPFQNYNSVINSIKILNSSNGYNMGMRRFTISTVGLIQGMNKLPDDLPQVNLAVSLHAADDELRNSLVPINKRFPLKILMKACEDYVTKTNRRISFEWALIENVNDSLQQAHNLVSLIKKSKVLDTGLSHVNLIQLNPISNYQAKPSTNQKTISFKKVLESNQIPCTIRRRRGIDINAGCGQLATNA